MKLIAKKIFQNRRNLIYECHNFAKSMELEAPIILDSCLRQRPQHPTITLVDFHILIFGKKEFSNYTKAT